MTKIELGETSFKFKEIKLKSRSDHESTFQIQGVQVGNSDRLYKVVAHVFNFPEMDTQCLNLDFDIWKIDLQVIDFDYKKAKKVIRPQGIEITHMLSITRTDGKPFDFSKAERILENLQFFLSFTRGGWVGIGHIHGFGRGEIDCFESWDVDRITIDQVVWQWLPKTRPQDIKKAWEGFAPNFIDNSLNEIMRIAIDLYVQANTALIPNIRLVLAMIALEALTGTINEKTGWIRDKNSKVVTADRIRLMLAWAGISIDDLGYVKDVHDMKSGSFPIGWTSGPEITTNLRNWTVHATSENRKELGKISRLAIYRAAQLAVWHLELVLLRLIGYDGQYRKRTQPNVISHLEYEQVPWAIKV